MREAKLTREDETTDSGEFADAEAIASHFGLPKERLDDIRQICRWADEQACAQGIDVSSNESLIVEPAE